jgi:hypothetical protein
MKWYFTPQNDEEENSIEVQGTYNIDSYYDSQTIKIENPRTSITGFYEIFNKVQFTDINTGSTFRLGINHITEYMVLDEIFTIEFLFHRSVPQIAFQIEDPIIAGAVEIQSSTENLLIFQSFIDKNLRLHFEDHVFKIPRCNRCGAALTVHNKVDVEDEVINEDFVCMDCYMVINNFYNLLENEIYKITDPHQMKEQRDNLVKFLMTGKKNASKIEESQLQHFYNLLIIYVEYLSGNLDTINVLQKIQAVQTIGANNNYPLLQKEAENLLTRIELRPKEIPEEKSNSNDTPETWIPPGEPTSEPTPPPVPLGTPSPATILPQDKELSNGLQSLEDVQGELQSTLDALSQIESDLTPRPISPTDHMHALNTELEENPDKIPTYDDIKETFSDLESIDFPDIQFGTSSEEFSDDLKLHDQLEQNEASLNSPSGTNQDISEPHFEIPRIQELPNLQPSSEQDHILDADLRNITESKTPPRLNPPPKLVPPQVPPPTNYAPPAQVNSHLEQEIPSVQTEPSLSSHTPGSLEEIAPIESSEDKNESQRPLIPPPRPSFFNSVNNGYVNKNKKPDIAQTKQVAVTPKPRPKQTRLNRKRNPKIRRIICTFCGTTLNQGKKVCPNCGSPIT